MNRYDNDYQANQFQAQMHYITRRQNQRPPQNVGYQQYQQNPYQQNQQNGNQQSVYQQNQQNAYQQYQQYQHNQQNRNYEPQPHFGNTTMTSSYTAEDEYDDDDATVMSGGTYSTYAADGYRGHKLFNVCYAFSHAHVSNSLKKFFQARQSAATVPFQVISIKKLSLFSAK